MAGRSYSRILAKRLNLGNSKRDKKKYIVKPDLHDKIQDPSEIGYEELSNIFLSNVASIGFFVKMKILKIKRKENRTIVFDREHALKILSNFVVNGRLTSKDILKKKRKLKL